MPPEDRVRIQHMIEAAETALRFQGKMSTADLSEDQQALFAIIRAVEILGEAASRITSETRKANPHIPWRYIIAMRNRLIHGYFDIDAEIVWNTVSNELPSLIPQLQEMIER